MIERKLVVWPLLAYGGLRMPLALLELPLFVLLPNFYSDTLGLPLGLVGGILFTTRLLDAFLDPAIGTAIDRKKNLHFRTWIWLSLPVSTIGFVALMHPPENLAYLSWWLAGMSIVTYLGYSVASIAYQAWGSQIGTTDPQRAQVTGFREAFGLAGVLLAAAWLTPSGIPILTALFVSLSAVAAGLLLFAPTGNRPRSWNTLTESELKTVGVTDDIKNSFRSVRANRPFRWLLAALLINGIATAIPATLLLFFVTDILSDAAQAPLFLLIYFVAGAIGMPVWIRLSNRLGLRKTWIVGIGVSVAAFTWTLTLGPGDSQSFMVICGLTGLALGADLALPPALLASVIAAHGDSGRNEGAYFGVWSFATKLNLAAAAGLALPALSLAGYVPGTPGAASLVIIYAGLPCVMKLLCAAVLWVTPIPDNVTIQPT
ncbi:MAG: MFS transporter [Burkholderiaceae bacterium]